MKLHTLSLAPLATAGLFLGYLAHLQAGEVAPMPMFQPTSDCDACNDPGMYGGVSLLYLKPYGNDGSEGSGGEWDPGFRATLGYERPDGLFFELNGMWFDGEYDLGSDGSEGSYRGYFEEQNTWYIEAIVGDNLHCGELCVDYGFGLRYGTLENKYGNNYYGNQSYVQHNRYERTFEGIGPVFRLDATRELNQQVSLYGGASQAILFGDYDYKNSNSYSELSPPSGIPSNSKGGNSREELAFVTEIEFGVQFNLDMAALQGVNIRLGVEGQYWAVDGDDLGFVGGVLGAGFNF